MVAVASPHMARAVPKATPKSALPLFLFFLVTAGSYTYYTAKSEGANIDAARHRFLTTKQRNDLRISGGAPIEHLDEQAAHLPSTYKGIGSLGQWSFN